MVDRNKSHIKQCLLICKKGFIMKKLKMTKVVVSMALLSVLGSTYALAESDSEYRCGHNPYGYGMMGQGQGMMGQGYGARGQGMMGQGYNEREYEPIPEAKAKKMINQYIKDNLKGYEVIKVEKQRVPMGIMYWAIVKDKSGNEFEIHLNPWGYIRGPFVR